MSLLERDTVMVSTDEEGNAVVDLPHTRVNNVEGLGRSFNTYYSVGNVVYVDSNLSVALKCTTVGTTSNTELDISTKVVGESVEDGSVVWEVINRDYTKDYEQIASSYLPLTGGTMRGNISFEGGGSLGSKDGYLTMNGRVLGVQNGDYPAMQNQINLSMLPDAMDAQVEYVAPAIGWLCITGVSSSVYSSLWLRDIAFENTYGIGIPAARADVRMQITLPVVKGRVYLLKFEACKEVKGTFWYTSEEEW